MIDYYKHKQITEMLSNKRKGGYSFYRKERFKSERNNLPLESNSDKFDSLKKEVKRIEIMTRMENREKVTISTCFSKGRPHTSMKQSFRHPNMDFRKVGKEYQKEKSLVKTALEETTVAKQKESGLLGEWAKYEEFTKHQLIQKLISLEHLANTIFKKNKYLQEQIKKLKTNADSK